MLVVVTGELQPWLAATLAGLVPPPLGEQPPTAPDREAVARAYAVRTRCCWSPPSPPDWCSSSWGRVATARGSSGVAVAVLCCAVVSLRARRQRAGLGGTVALVGGLAPLAPVAVAVWWQWPDGRVAVVATVAGVGLLALAAVLLPTPRTARAGRLAELAEGLALVALPPALLAATGLLDVVREVVG